MWRSSSSSSSSSSSLSSSACSLTSPCNHNPVLPKTMEEVWNDISIPFPSYLHHASSGAGVVLQDFFSREPPPAAVCSSHSQPPPPPTTLTLSSAHDCFRSSLLLKPHHQPSSPLNVLPFNALVSGGIACGGKKRFLDSDRFSGDRSHRRMMKNRLSAARSRARKQENHQSSYFKLLLSLSASLPLFLSLSLSLIRLKMSF